MRQIKFYKKVLDIIQKTFFFGKYILHCSY